MQRTNDIQIRDPFVLADAASGRYYMYGTTDPHPYLTPSRCFDCYVSDNLEDWQGPFTVFCPPPDFWADRQFWAAEVHAYEGRYVMLASFKAAHACRGTQALVADSPLGPFVPHSHGPLTPTSWECLDGTLFVDDAAQPWLVFCHEWLQVRDGRICAMPLTPDLSAAAGEPVVLFSASEATWSVCFPHEIDGQHHALNHVTDGPFLKRASDGTLLMLWSTTGAEGYTMGVARSASGDVCGPWEQLPEPLYRRDGGHGMIFNTFAGQQLLAIHQPNRTPDERPMFLPLWEEGGMLMIEQVAVLV